MQETVPDQAQIIFRDCEHNENRSTKPTGFTTLRAIGNALAFASFMGIALGYALVVFPLIRIFPGKTEVKRRRARRIIGGSFNYFIRSCCAFGLMRPPRVTGFENLEPGRPFIIVANHPTLMDVVVLGSLIHDFNCVINHKLLSNMFLRGGIEAAGYVANNRAEEILKRCIESFQVGQPLIIFPEGTRSPENGLGKFSRGAAHLALRTEIPIITAFITCEPLALAKGQKLLSIPNYPIQFTVEFSRFSWPEQSSPTNCHSIQSRLLTEQLELFFRERIVSISPQRK